VLGPNYSYTSEAQVKERIDHSLNDASRSGRAYSFDPAGRVTEYANFNVSVIGDASFGIGPRIRPANPTLVET
jgi:hypothetical protein